MSKLVVFSFFAVFMFAPVLRAETVSASAQKPLATKASVQISGERATVTPGPKCHLNKDAPAALTTTDSPSNSSAKSAKLAPVEKSEQRFVFQLPGKSGAGHLRFYVCDDANTICEPHDESISWGSSGGPSLNDQPTGKSNLTDDLSKALQAAEHDQRLVLIDFAARWCPPCIRLEHEVFNSQEFRSLQPRLDVVRIDVDREENFDLLQKYGVKAYPTLVLVNSRGEELERYLDFQEKTPFVASLKKILSAAPRPASERLAKASAAGTSERVAAADYLYKSMQYDAAVKMYEKTLGLRYWDARVNAAEEKLAEKTAEAQSRHQSALRDAIQAEPDSFLSLDWRLALAESLGSAAPESKDLARETIALAKRWIEDPRLLREARQKGQLLEIKDLEIPEAHAKMGDAYKSLGDERAFQDSYAKAVDAVLRLKPDEKSPTQVIYLVAYMKKFKPLAEIEPWLSRLEAAYPAEFTYPYRHANLLFEKKDPERALSLAQKAYALSYGNNQFTSGLLIAKIKAELKRKDESKALLSELLAKPQAKSPRNKRIVAQIEDYLKTL